MAKLSFVLESGEEKTYKLNPHTSFRIGRDPGNDVVLRDPKVSRHHAEVVFERGFFVLHDLESSNGTYINGKRIRVAPLTHGADLKLGNTRGRFVEEFTAEPGATISAEVPQTDPLPPASGEHSHHFESPDLDAAASAGPRTILEGDLPQIEEEWKDPKFERSRFLIDRGVAYGECLAIRDEEAKPLFFLPRTFNWTVFAAAVIGGLVVLAGLTVFVFLLIDRRYPAAVAAAALTLAFVVFLRKALPRRVLRLWNDEALTRLSLVLEQQRRFPAGATFASRAADGSIVGYVKKNSPLAFGRRRWTLFDHSGVLEVASATETSLSRAMLRKFLGEFFGRLRNDYRIETHGRPGGMLFRTTTDPRDVLDLSADAFNLVDRRLAVSLLVAIYSFERS